MYLNLPYSCATPWSYDVQEKICEQNKAVISWTSGEAVLNLSLKIHENLTTWHPDIWLNVFKSSMLLYTLKLWHPRKDLWAKLELATKLLFVEILSSGH